VKFVDIDLTMTQCVPAFPQDYNQPHHDRYRRNCHADVDKHFLDSMRSALSHRALKACDAERSKRDYEGGKIEAVNTVN
jgi:hypothetical protein